MAAATLHLNTTIVPPNFPGRLPALTPPTPFELYKLIPDAAMWGLY